jgi:hypothetical protein
MNAALPSAPRFCSSHEDRASAATDFPALPALPPRNRKSRRQKFVRWPYGQRPATPRLGQLAAADSDGDGEDDNNGNNDAPTSPPYSPASPPYSATSPAYNPVTGEDYTRRDNNDDSFMPSTPEYDPTNPGEHRGCTSGEEEEEDA